MSVPTLDRLKLPRFKPSTGFTVGVEEELHVVSPATHERVHGTDALLERGTWGAGEAKGEICDGVIEFVTPVCTHAGEAADVLRTLRGAAAQQGVALLGAGLHPQGDFGDVRHRDGHRYALIAETMRGVIRQTPHCGLHVHVGMPDADTTIRAYNGMRRWLPLLQALGANSPFWYGQDSGLASARSVISASFPRSGAPGPFSDYADFESTVAAFHAIGDCPDYSLLWWDLRPHPRLGTLEVRILDAQSSLEDVAALTALIHCLAVHEATEPSDCPVMTPEVLRAVSFAAARDGLDARVPFEDTWVPARHAAVLALTLAGHHAVDVGCWEELMSVQRMVEVGNGAARQRRAADAGGVVAAVDQLVAETTPALRFVRSHRAWVA